MFLKCFRILHSFSTFFLLKIFLGIADVYRFKMLMAYYRSLLLVLFSYTSWFISLAKSGNTGSVSDCHTCCTACKKPEEHNVCAFFIKSIFRNQRPTKALRSFKSFKVSDALLVDFEKWMFSKQGSWPLSLSLFSLSEHDTIHTCTHTRLVLALFRQRPMSVKGIISHVWP